MIFSPWGSLHPLEVGFGERLRVAVRCEISLVSASLRTMIDMQDFDGVGLHCLHDDVRERRQRQFSCSAPVTRSARVR